MNECPKCSGPLTAVSVVVDEETGTSGRTALAAKLDMPNPQAVTAAPYVVAAIATVVLAFVLGIALGHGPVAGFTFYFLLAAAIAIFIGGFVRRDREQKAVDREWRRMKGIWERLYYCRRDGLVVFPGDSSNPVHRDDMIELLRRRY
jgi:hypothetical protein